MVDFTGERNEYEMKLRKLVELHRNDDLPDTPFVNSFIPRVNAKFHAAILPLTLREKEVIDDMFDKY